MKTLISHLYRDLSKLLILLLTVIVFSCKEELKKEGYVVKIGNTKLTESEINDYLGSYRFKAKSREEFIRQWIETELLYSEALSKNILSSEKYRSIQRRSQKELAGALILKNYFSNTDIDFSRKELLDFFNANKDEFKLVENAVIINKISFKDEQTAINFRTDLLKSNWENALKNIKADTSIVVEAANSFLYLHQVPNLKLLRAINELQPGEISIILKTEPQLFTVVQLTSRLNKGEIPDYKYVDDFVRERYMMNQQKYLYDKFIENLYSKYNVEINREVE